MCSYVKFDENYRLWRKLCLQLLTVKKVESVTWKIVTLKIFVLFFRTMHVKRPPTESTSEKVACYEYFLGKLGRLRSSQRRCSLKNVALRPVTVLKRDSSTDGFLSIMQNFQEDLYIYRKPQVAVSKEF